MSILVGPVPNLPIDSVVVQGSSPATSRSGRLRHGTRFILFGYDDPLLDIKYKEFKDVIARLALNKLKELFEQLSPPRLGRPSQQGQSLDITNNPDCYQSRSQIAFEYLHEVARAVQWRSERCWPFCVRSGCCSSKQKRAVALLEEMLIAVGMIKKEDKKTDEVQSGKSLKERAEEFFENLVQINVLCIDVKNAMKQAEKLKSRACFRITCEKGGDIASGIRSEKKLAVLRECPYEGIIRDLVLFYGSGGNSRELFEREGERLSWSERTSARSAHQRSRSAHSGLRDPLLAEQE